MLKWLLVIALVVVLSGVLGAHAGRGLRLGALPGDLVLRVGRRTFRFPFTSTLLLSLLAWLILRAL